MKEKIINNKKKLAIISLFIIALLIRLVYIHNTPYYENQHDIEPNGNGLAYILNVYNGQLPDNNDGQNYHPPCNQIISAFYLNIMTYLIGFQEPTIFESLQILTVIYSMFLWYGVYKITKILRLKFKTTFLTMAAITFNPTLVIFSGSLNNDGLCLTFSVWVLYMLIKWYKNPKDIKSFITLAILTGLNVMTKTTGALIALPIAYCMILIFYRDFKNAENKKIVCEKYFWLYLLFGAISLPIGLWFNFRNLVLFGQPILYVFDTHNMDLYNGNYSFVQRFLSYSFKGINRVYCDPWTEYNILSYLTKCSLYGEFEFGKTTMDMMFYIVSIFSNILLFIVSLFTWIRTFISNTKRYLVFKISLALLGAFNIISYFMTNINLPYGCTMDYRYLATSLICSILLIGLENERRERLNKNNKLFYISVLLLTLVTYIAADLVILL